MRYFPSSLQQPGLGEVQNVTGPLDTFLVKQLHALAISIGQAKDRGDKQTVAMLLDRFRSLAEEYRGRGDVDLTGTDKFILATQKWIEDAVTALPSAISALPKAIGFGLIEGLLPFAAIAVAFLFLKKKALE